MTLLTPQASLPSSPEADRRRTRRAFRHDGPPAGGHGPGDDPPAPTVAGQLAELLFDGDDRERIHGPWRDLIAKETFRHRPGLGPEERTAQAYDWLRLVNDTAGSAERLADDPELLAGLHEWAAVVDGGGGLCTVASIHYNLFLGSLLDHGGAGGRDLSDFTALRRTGTFLCTELDHGNDASALETTAELDPVTGGFVLHTPHPGAQKFMPNTSTTGGPKSAVVAARLLVDGRDEGVFLFLTPLSDDDGLLPGVRVRRLPLRAGAPLDHCLTAFERVLLPRTALLESAHGRLDAEGRFHSSLGNRRKRFLQSIGRVTMGKLCMSGAAVGAARAALAVAVRYGDRRRVGGPRAGERVPVNTHRSHHGRLLQALATAYAMTFLHRSVLARWSAQRAHPDAGQRAEAERLVAVAKGWITWQARDITVECRERCGAQGLFAANGLSEFPQYIEGTITAEGDNLVIWVKAAAEMLFEHQPSDRELASPGGAEQLTDVRHLRELLARAESLWQDRARAQLRRGPSGNPVERWNSASSAALEMVSVHARLRAADAFLDAAERAAGTEARELLRALCRLFLLQQLREHSGDLLAEGHLSAEQVRGLPQLLDDVLRGLAPHMTELVDAFDLPAAYLDGIPLAGSGRVSLADYSTPAG
ncbi:acyl-CoA dehydrogenase [Streptomyces sp. TG1A-8]|uniref:acyl-CoA dehydrogenase family protein n=1 Tax=Streptomyces sp. TG1A-8 TaxID=3051385 RepID=UPI00265B96AA|nr:acyl-CoA dehydrogenase [Streptomyces sp. TG1A-8]MDO0929275.1 acyl-CoA dehydrogenase [Streptomyces sp. TG1A-8]